MKKYWVFYSIPILIWGFIGYVKVDLALKQHYGVVRDREQGYVYPVQQYGSYERALEACLYRDLKRSTLCGPSWK